MYVGALNLRGWRTSVPAAPIPNERIRLCTHARMSPKHSGRCELESRAQCYCAAACSAEHSLAALLATQGVSASKAAVKSKAPALAKDGNGSSHGSGSAAAGCPHESSSSPSSQHIGGAAGYSWGRTTQNTAQPATRTCLPAHAERPTNSRGERLTLNEMSGWPSNTAGDASASDESCA